MSMAPTARSLLRNLTNGTHDLTPPHTDHELDDDTALSPMSEEGGTPHPTGRPHHSTAVPLRPRTGCTAASLRHVLATGGGSLQFETVRADGRVSTVAVPLGPNVPPPRVTKAQDAAAAPAHGTRLFTEPPQSALGCVLDHARAVMETQALAGLVALSHVAATRPVLRTAHTSGTVPTATAASSSTEADAEGLPGVAALHPAGLCHPPRRVGFRPAVNRPRDELPAAEYSGGTPREAYCAFAARFGVKPNSAVAAGLSTDPFGFGALHTIAAEGNLIGERGVLPLLELARLCPAVTALELPECGLTSASAEWIAEYALTAAPRLRRLNVSGNAIGPGGMLCLIEAVRKNAAITECLVEGTAATVNLQDCIVQAARANKAAAMASYDEL